MVGVVGHDQRVRRVLDLHQRDHLVRLHHGRHGEHLPDDLRRERPLALVAEHGHAVDRRDVDREARYVLRHVPRRRRRSEWPQRSDVTVGESPDSASSSSVESTRRSIAPGRDVVVTARVDVDAGVGEDAPGKRAPAHPRCGEPGFASGRKDEAGRCEQPPAGEEGRRVDPRRTAQRGPDGQDDAAERARAHRAERRAARDGHTAAQLHPAAEPGVAVAVARAVAQADGMPACAGPRPAHRGAYGRARGGERSRARRCRRRRARRSRRHRERA